MKKQPKQKRGSILIVALFVASVGGLLAASFLKSVVFELKQVDDTFARSNALNLAAAGIEAGVLALNEEDWMGWTIETRYASKTLDTFDLGQEQSGEVTVSIEDLDSDPTIISDSTVTLASGKQLSEQIKVLLKPRSLFANGLTVTRRTYFLYRGDITLDSYDSTAGPYDEFLNRNDHGTIASAQVRAYQGSNARIYGYLASDLERSGWYRNPQIRERNNPLRYQIGRGGSVSGSSTPTGTKVDLDRVVGNFKANMPEVEVPQTKRVITISPTRPVISIGRSTRERVFKIEDDVVINAGQTLRIAGNVALVIEGDLYVYGTLEVVPPFGELKLYLRDGLSVTGAGLINQTEDPTKMIIYQTTSNTYGDTIWLGGDEPIYASIYAPKASVYLFGLYRGRPFYGANKTYHGAVVGRNVLIYGDYDFHYDEALREAETANRTYAIEEWYNPDPELPPEGRRS